MSARPRVGKHSVAVGLCLTVFLSSHAPICAQNDPFKTVQRGINNYSYVGRPDPDGYRNRKAYSYTPNESSILEQGAHLKSMGLSFIRLVIDIRPLLNAWPNHRDPMNKVGRVAEAIARSGMCVILLPHVPGVVDASSAAEVLTEASINNQHPYRKILEELADLAERSLSCSALELFSEPPFCGMQLNPWPSLQDELLRHLRERGFRKAIILTGACFSNLQSLLQTNFSTTSDPNTLFTFHFYEPSVFTHQGATFSAPFLRYVEGLSYPYDSFNSSTVRRTSIQRLNAAVNIAQSEKLTIAERINAALDDFDTARPNRRWIEARLQAATSYLQTLGISRERVLIGEFGALAPHSETVDDVHKARIRWLKDFREAAKAHHLKWAFWNDFGNDFGLFKRPEDHCPDPNISAALGLSSPCK